MTEPSLKIAAKPKPRSNSFSLAQGASGFNAWAVRLEEGMSFDDVLQPEFWSNVAAELFRGKFKGAGDLIEVMNHDCTRRGTLSVVSASETWLKVGWYQEPTSILKEVRDLPADAPLATKWNVGTRSHDVLRKADKQIIKAGFPLKEDAIAWAVQHIKAMAA